VRNHLKRAADATLDFFKQERFDRIAIGITDELWPELEKVLHPYLRERLEGRFAVDINSTADEILTKVTLIEDAHRSEDQKLMLESLGPELDAGKVFVGGLDDVLQMLNQRRVDLLLVEEGYHEAGKHCPVCNTLEFGEEVCPTCGHAVDQVTDVVEAAMELAVRQDALVKTIPLGHPAMTQAGHVAARLRY
jgi:peptide subunit release factor 1 (eRF1)